MEKPVVWISSPAGSGKTTLVSSYLEARKLPCIWYQCDEGDADLATFFYYMGLAAKKVAPRYKTPLLLLTPEYVGGIPAFTRRYFEQLYSRLITRSASSPRLASRPSAKGDQGGHSTKRDQERGALARRVKGGFFIVFDNYQDVPADSAFHDMIVNGFDLIPDGIQIVVISRSYPAAPLARLQANDKISLLEYNDIRFTLEESKELLHHRIPHLDNESVKKVYEGTEGWAAGIILMLAKRRLKGKVAESAADFTYDNVFDYFAGEIFNKTEKEVQDFLLKTSFLPVLSIPLAEKLTGIGNAGRILASLNSQNFFTERLSGSGQDFQYHPLFRNFLLNRVKSTSTPEELAFLQKEAGRLLEQSGQVEDAARLYADAGDGPCLARMTVHHAREFLTQGRNKTVAEWIAAIPAQAVGNDPWLLYWDGMCSFLLDMVRTRECLEKALALFLDVDDSSGVYLSWAGIFDTYVYELGDWRNLDHCIEVCEDLRSRYPSFPSRETDMIVSSRMLISLILRNTDQTERLEEWLERVSSLFMENPSFDVQMDTVFYMSLYFLWTGAYGRNEVLLERATADVLQRDVSPFAVIRVKMMQGIHYWVTARYDDALKTLSGGLDIAEKSGVHVFDSMLWSFQAAAQMATGCPEQAQKSLNHQRESFLAMNNTLDVFFYHINCAWYALLQGNASKAAGHMETISGQVEKMGTPYYRALWHIGMAQVTFGQDRTGDAHAHINKAYRIGRNMKSRIIEWYSLLISAWFLLREGRKTEGLGALRRGLALGKGYGYVHLEFYQPVVMQFLYARALAEGIEPEYVKGLIRKLKLAPPASVFYLEDWPYPLKIDTLGKFEILMNDEPLVFAGKAQKKPLELLKAVIAAGGVNVPVERLTDALWPDADGDLAHKSFDTTLSRLRRLLGEDHFIRYGAGQLSLDPLSCRVDSLLLEKVFDKIKKAPADQVLPLCEKAAGLYKGSFLPSDAGLQWTVARREMLKNRMLRVIILAGRHFEQTGQWEKASEYYIQGLEIDDLAEEFSRLLMICYQKSGNVAEAIKAYDRCRRRLQVHLGIGPSAETEAVYSSIMPKR